MSNPLQDNPYLQLDFISKVVKDMVVVDPNYSIIDAYIPTTDQNPKYGTTIKWDIDVVDEGGMTPLTDPNAASPLVTGGAFRQKSWTPPHFRNKTRLDASHFMNLRELGTSDEQRAIGKLVIKWLARLRRMIDNRQLWLKWQAVQSNAAMMVYGAGVTQRLDYSGVGYHPTVVVNWNAAGAQILDDVISFVSMFRSAATAPEKCMYGTTVMSAMLSDATVRAIITQQIYRRVNDSNIFNTVPGQTGLEMFLKSMFAGIEFEYYQEGPPISLKVTRDSTGQTIPVAGPGVLFRVGETVDHIQPDNTRTSIVIGAINLGNGTLQSVTLAGVASPRGTLIRKRMEFINFDQFVIFSKVPGSEYPGAGVESDGNDYHAELVTVENVHGQGGLDRPESGIVTRVIDNTDDDPPSKEIIASFTGGVVPWREDGPWLSATVLS